MASPADRASRLLSEAALARSPRATPSGPASVRDAAVASSAPNEPRSATDPRDEVAGQGPLSPYITEVIAQLRIRTAFYLEAIQAMSDGVTLGVEQVQETRIARLERGAPSDFGAMAWAFLVEMVVAGPIGRVWAAAATRAVILPIMRAMAVPLRTAALTAQRLGELRRSADRLRDLRRILGDKASEPWNPQLRTQLLPLIERTIKALETELRPGRRRRAFAEARTQARAQASEIGVALNEVAERIPDHILGLAEGTKGALGAMRSRSESEHDNTLAVSLRSAAMSSAARLRLTLIEIHARLEVHLEDPGVTVEEAAQILDDYRADARFTISRGGRAETVQLTGFEVLAIIRDAFQLAVEVTIWAKYLIDANTAAAAEERDKQARGKAPEVGDSDVSGVPSWPPSWRMTPFGRRILRFSDFLVITGDRDILPYVMIRLRPEVERWVAETDAEVPLEQARNVEGVPNMPRQASWEGDQPPSLPPGWWDAIEAKEREDLFVQYLVEVARASEPWKLSFELNAGAPSP